MYYLQDRYYYPQIQQFISPDPLNAEIPYAFDADDPTDAGDPTGEMFLRMPGSTGLKGSDEPPPTRATDAAAYYRQVTKQATPKAKAPAAPKPPAPAKHATTPNHSGNPLVTAFEVIAAGAPAVASGADLVAAGAGVTGFEPVAAAAAGASLLASGAACMANAGLDVMGHGDALNTTMSCGGAFVSGMAYGISKVADSVAGDATDAAARSLKKAADFAGGVFALGWDGATALAGLF